MGLMDRWRRRRGHRSAAAPTLRGGWANDGEDPDGALPVLSRGQAGELVSLARRTFAEHGRETVYDGAGALLGDGNVHGLTNLAATAAQLPRGKWEGLVRRHVESMLAADATPEPQSMEQARDLLLPRLRRLADVPWPAPSYAPEVLPGIVAVAALDYPTHVSELITDARVDGLGGWVAIRDAAWQNLRRLPAPSVMTVQADPGDGQSTVLTLNSEDFFGASRLLVLDEVLAAQGIERPSHGLLVAVPNRHLVVVHVLQGPGLVSAMQLMARTARGQCEGQPGALSPEVYYRSPDGVGEQVTWSDDETGAVSVRVAGGFEAAMRSLGLLS